MERGSTGLLWEAEAMCCDEVRSSQPTALRPFRTREGFTIAISARQTFSVEAFVLGPMACEHSGAGHTHHQPRIIVAIAQKLPAMIPVRNRA
jgi:hypothetical protein